MDPIVKTITVNCSAEHAFNVFVYRIGTWWPLKTHAVSAGEGKPALNATIEPKVDGAIYETKHDGTRTDWGKVTVFEPGVRFAMTWHPGTDGGKSTHVDITFTEKDGKTTVTLTHSGWEAWGNDADQKVKGYNSGWTLILNTLYAPACEIR